MYYFYITGFRCHIIMKILGVMSVMDFTNLINVDENHSTKKSRIKEIKEDEYSNSLAKVHDFVRQWRDMLALFVS